MLKERFIILVITIVVAINSHAQEIATLTNPIHPGEVLINGHIEHYRGTVKTGALYFKDAVTMFDNQEVFSIDLEGNFKTFFELACPTMNSSIRIDNIWFTIYLVPGKTYNITINENGTHYFTGDNSEFNNDVLKLNTAIASKFRKDNDKLNLYYKNDKSDFQSLENFCNDLLQRKIIFVDEYGRKEKISQKAIDLIKHDLFYESSHSLIIYRNLYTSRYRKTREGIPINFYQNLYTRFQINNPEAIGSLYYGMYINNIKDVIWENYFINNKIYDYLKETQKFSDRELFLISCLYKNDTTIRKTEEFTEFFNRRRGEITDLSNKYWARMLLDSVGHFPKGLGRDLIISQGISDFFLDEKTLSPSPSEWTRIDSLLSDKNILAYLKRIDQYNQALAAHPISSKTNILQPLLKDESDKVFENLIGKYKGKVVYIDFWATWCGPCRHEIPHSKVLGAHFAGQDVIFLNLCCQSDKKVWEATIKSEEMTGDHYLLCLDEYNFLLKLFNIHGVPTYALIDKEGNIINKNAPRPSDGPMTIAAIDELLK